MMPIAYQENGLQCKEVSVAENMTVNRIISFNQDRALICSNDRNTLNSFLESWMENHLGDAPIVYFHQSNDIMSVLFRQLLPQSLIIGNSMIADYDPLKEIPLPFFFNELVARSQTLNGKISVPYLKGIASLLLFDHYEPTLYRLNCYANKHLGRILENHSEDMDDDTFAMLNRYMQKNDSLVENTLDYLDMLCDACGTQLNRGSMRQGKSIYSALKSGMGVAINVAELSNPIAADMIFTQLALSQKQGLHFQLLLDIDVIPDNLVHYLAEISTAQIKLLVCPNIWAIAHKDGVAFAENLLSSRSQTIFFPNNNMQLCKNLSTYLDTYWRENRTYSEGTQRGRNRKALSILPMYANGKHTNIAVAYMRESILSANELRALPKGAAIMLIDSVPSIIACQVSG